MQVLVESDRLEAQEETMNSLKLYQDLILKNNFIYLFCQKWSIEEFSFFGSVLRDDFSEVSDIGVMVSFSSTARWSLFDLMDMREELETQFGRKVDLINKKAVEKSKNPYRRDNILKSYEVVYAKKLAALLVE